MKAKRVGFDKLSKRERFRFLGTALADLDSARVAIELAERQHGFTPIERDHMLKALSEVAIIRYARPFIGTMVAADRKSSIPDRFLDAAGLNTRQKKRHAAVVDLRHTDGAHTQVKRRRMKHVKIPGMYGHQAHTVSRIDRKFADLAELRHV